MSKDIIYREDAIEAIHSYWKGELSKMPTTNSEYGEVIDGDCDTLLKHNKELSTRIKNIPSADRPQGEWLLLEPRYSIEQKVYWNKEQALADTKGNGALERRKCSCCGYTKQFSGYMKDKAFKLWSFCPNCGADMREREDK